MRRSWSMLSLPLLFTLASCGDDPIAPVKETSAALPVEAVESPVASAGGVVSPVDALLAGSFSFLAPLPQTPLTSVFDASVLPSLTVEVCAPVSCGVTAAARYTSLTGPGSETIRLAITSDFFVVNWKPADSKLTGPAVYRVRVLAAGLVLGSANVRLYKNGTPVLTGVDYALQEKSTLAVKFRVGRNAVITARIAAANGGSASDVAALLVAQFNSSANDVAVILDDAGFPPADIAAALRTKLGQTAAQTAALLTSLSIVSDAVALTNALVTGGYPVADVLAVLRDAGQTAAQAAGTARSAGVSAADVGGALGSVFGITQSAVLTALQQAGYPATEVGAWLVATGGDVTTVAGQLRVAGYAIDDVVAFAKANGVTDLAAMAAVLKAAGFTLTEIAAWLTAGGMTQAGVTALLKTLGYSIDDVAAWLSGTGLDDTGTAGALVQAGWTLAEVAIHYGDAGRTPDQIVVILKGAGASAYDIGAVLVTEFGKTVNQVGTSLKNAGFDGETVFDALYEVGTDILNNPVDFALRVAIGAMKGAGYGFAAFKDKLFGGIKEWTKEQLVDALGLSGYSIAEVTDFALNVMGVTVDMLMTKAKAWGVPLDDITDALLDAGATVDDIVAGAKSAYNATADAVADALADAGAAAYDVAVALMNKFNDTLDQAAARLKQAGYQAGVVFDAVYRAATEVLNHPVDFALNLTLAVMEGAGYFLDNFKDRLVGGIKDWTQEQLIDALGLSGYSIADLTEFMLNVMGLTAELIAERAESWGIPVSEVIDALDDAGATMNDIVAAVADAYELTADELAAAMKAAGKNVGAFANAMMSFYNQTEDAVAASLKSAGYLAADVGDWLVTKLTGTAAEILERAADKLANAGYTFDNVADWVWEKTGHIADKTASALRYAGYTAERVAEYFVTRLGLTAEKVFEFLQLAGYSAAEVAHAVYTKANASITAIGGWLSEYYQLGVSATSQILHDLGGSLADLISVMINVYQATLSEATSILLGFSYTVAEILAAWTG